MKRNKFEYPYNAIVAINEDEYTHSLFSAREMEQMKNDKSLEATFECILLTEKNLSVRGRDVIKLYFKNGLTYDEIGKNLGISRARVGQLFHKSLRVIIRSDNRQKLIMGFAGYYENLAIEAHKKGFEQGSLAGYTKACSEDKEQRKINRGALTVDDLYNQGMSVRLYNSLKRGGINTIADIVADVDKVVLLRNFGSHCLQELVRLLNMNGADTAPFNDYLYTGAYKELAAQRMSAKRKEREE